MAWLIYFSLMDVSSISPHKDAEKDEEIFKNSKIIIVDIVSNSNVKARYRDIISIL